MIKYLIPESGSGILIKLKKMLFSLHSRTGKHNKCNNCIENNTKTEGKIISGVAKTREVSMNDSVLQNISSISEKSKIKKHSRKNESASQLIRDTKLPQITCKENKVNNFIIIIHREWIFQTIP